MDVVIERRIHRVLIPIWPLSIAEYVWNKPNSLRFWFIALVIAWSFLFGTSIKWIVFPVLDSASQKAPESLYIAGGRLQGIGFDRYCLAGSRYFAIYIDNQPVPWFTEEADFTFYLFNRGVGFKTLFVRCYISYPKNLNLDLSRDNLLAWWVTVRPHLFIWILIGCAVIVGGWWTFEAWIFGLISGRVLYTPPDFGALCFRISKAWVAFVWLGCWLLYIYRQFPFWGLLPSAIALWLVHIVWGAIAVFLVHKKWVHFSSVTEKNTF